MSRVLAIATNTFRESVRDRVLYSILFFAVIVVLTSVMIKDITIGDQAKVVRSVALGGIRLSSAAAAIFLGVSLVYKEIERKTIYTIVSKPIPRWLFLVGKYLGLMAVIAAQIALMALVYIGLMTLEQGFPHASVFASWLLLLMEMGLLTAWALLFSSYSSPVIATLFSISIFVIGHLVDDIARYGQQAESELTQQVTLIVSKLLPDLSLFNVHDSAVHHLPVPWDHVAYAGAYGLGYTTVVLAIAAMVFQTRDFK